VKIRTKNKKSHLHQKKGEGEGSKVPTKSNIPERRGEEQEGPPRESGVTSEQVKRIQQKLAAIPGKVDR